MKAGFVVNPYAGIGGTVALKGSDGSEIRDRALLEGAEKGAPARAATFLRLLAPCRDKIDFCTWGGEMGASLLELQGFECRVSGGPRERISTRQDTLDAVSRMQKEGVEYIFFVGGDGTARDVCSVLGDSLPVVGIPAGVKMHSAVYAKTPADAAQVVLSLVGGNAPNLRLAEVMDIDEEKFREGKLSAGLYGFMKIPSAAGRMQGMKASGFQEADALRGAARTVVAGMEENVFYVVGPGTSTRFVFELLNLEKTLLGVDVLYNGQIVAKDATYAGLKKLLQNSRYKVVVTVIGGQGCLFGRGNQQIGPDILRGLPRRDIIVMASREKLFSIPDAAFYNDTGDIELDHALQGYYRVVTASREETVFRCK